VLNRRPGGVQFSVIMRAWRDGCRSRATRSARVRLHRHGSALEADFDEAMADVRRTRALAKAAKGEGDEGDLLAATSGILQEQLLRISIALRQADADPAAAAKSISMVARAHSDVGRLQVALSKWQAEMRSKAELAAEACEQVAKRGGLTAEAVWMIRREILGIVD
jgi:hypothetical protein